MRHSQMPDSSWVKAGASLDDDDRVPAGDRVRACQNNKFAMILPAITLIGTIGVLIFNITNNTANSAENPSRKRKNIVGTAITFVLHAELTTAGQL